MKDVSQTDLYPQFYLLTIMMLINRHLMPHFVVASEIWSKFLEASGICEPSWNILMIL